MVKWKEEAPLTPLPKPPGPINHINEAVEKAMRPYEEQRLVVDYDQGNLASYRGVVLKSGKLAEEVKRWFGASFNQDWAEANNYCSEEKLIPVLDDSVHHYNQDVQRSKT